MSGDHPSPATPLGTLEARGVHPEHAELVRHIARRARAGHPVSPAEAQFVHDLLDPIVDDYCERHIEQLLQEDPPCTS